MLCQRIKRNMRKYFEIGFLLAHSLYVITGFDRRTRDKHGHDKVIKFGFLVNRRRRFFRRFRRDPYRGISDGVQGAEFRRLF